MTTIDFRPQALTALVDGLKRANATPEAADTTVTRRDALLIESEKLRDRHAEQDESIRLSTEAIRELKKARRRQVVERARTVAERQATDRAIRDLEVSWIGRRPEGEEESS